MLKVSSNLGRRGCNVLLTLELAFRAPFLIAVATEVEAEDSTFERDLKKNISRSQTMWRETDGPPRNGSGGDVDGWTSLGTVPRVQHTNRM